MDLKELDDRIKHIENTLPGLARIKEQSTCFDKIEDLSSTVEELIKTVSDIDEAISVNSCSQVVFKDEILDVKSDHEQKLEEMQTDILTLRSEMKVLKSFDEKNVPDIITQMQELQNALLQIEKKIKELEESIQEKVKLKDLDFIKSSWESSLNSTLEFVLSNISSKISEQQTYILDFQEKINNLVTGQQKIKDRSDAEKSFIDGVITDIKNKIDAKERNLKKELHDSIEALPTPERVDLNLIKESVRQDIEHFSLDAKNAYLKSNYNENRITILEKKIEQIYLMLQK